MSQHGNAISLRITYEDGVTMGADGVDATVIWKWLQSCESLCLLRAGPHNSYQGPFMKEIDALAADRTKEPK